MSPEEKLFFASISVGAARLSKCPQPKGCCLARGGRILSYGYNRKLIPEKPWEVSAIQDALFGVRDIDMTGSVIFSSHFPNLEDIKLIYATDIKTVYFFNDPDNRETVEFLNSLSNPLEMIRLKN